MASLENVILEQKCFDISYKVSDVWNVLRNVTGQKLATFFFLMFSMMAALRWFGPHQHFGHGGLIQVVWQEDEDGGWGECCMTTVQMSVEGAL